MHPLDGPRLKIRRAQKGIEDLRIAENNVRKQASYKIVRSEFNPKTGKFIYRCRVSDVTQLHDWGVFIGEIAHNLRSALDGLVFQLVHLNTDSPTRPSQFPVFLKRRNPRGPAFEGNARGNGQYMIGDLSQSHQKQIEALQPYKRGQGGRSNLLFLLSEINNADKHRLIQVVGAKTGAFVAGGWFPEGAEIPPPRLPTTILRDGVKLFEALATLHVSPNIIPLVAFWRGCDAVKRRGVCYTLDHIANHVSEIVESFGPEFD